MVPVTSGFASPVQRASVERARAESAAVSLLLSSSAAIAWHTSSVCAGRAAPDATPECAATARPFCRAITASIAARSEEHTSELQSLMRISYAVFCLNKKKHHHTKKAHNTQY